MKSCNKKPNRRTQGNAALKSGIAIFNSPHASLHQHSDLIFP